MIGKLKLIWTVLNCTNAFYPVKKRLTMPILKINTKKYFLFLLNYFSLWKDENSVKELKNSVKPIQLIRFMQVLGAYGFRGLIQRKPHFISSIDKGMENLQLLADSWEGMQQYPELKKLITALKSNSVKNKIESIIKNH